MTAIGEVFAKGATAEPGDVIGTTETSHNQLNHKQPGYKRLSHKRLSHKRPSHKRLNYQQTP